MRPFGCPGAQNSQHDITSPTFVLLGLGLALGFGGVAQAGGRGGWGDKDNELTGCGGARIYEGTPKVSWENGVKT